MLAKLVLPSKVTVVAVEDKLVPKIWNKGNIFYVGCLVMEGLVFKWFSDYKLVFIFLWNYSKVDICYDI